MTRYVLQIAYDGTGYYGWQKTAHGPSVEAAIEKALCQIFQQPIFLQAASRTDRGVHALGQVVDFVAENPCDDLSRLKVSMNQLLPSDIRCLKAVFAPHESFHPTLDVVQKQYRYFISTGSVQLPHNRFTHWHVRHPLNKHLLHEASIMFLGTHDFRGLCNRRADLDEEDTTRTVFSIGIEEEGEGYCITIDADRFLYKMARNIVGAIVWVALDKLSLSSVDRALATRQRALAGITAPAHGLVLTTVSYPHPLF